LALKSTCQNNFVKLVHLVGFIIKKLHKHVNICKVDNPLKKIKEHAAESQNFKSRFKSKFHNVFKISTKLLQAERISTNLY